MLTNTRFIFIFFCSFTQSDLLEAKANIVADDVMEPLLSTDEEDRAKCVHLYHSYPIRNQIFPPFKILTQFENYVWFRTFNFDLQWRTGGSGEHNCWRGDGPSDIEWRRRSCQVRPSLSYVTPCPSIQSSAIWLTMQHSLLNLGNFVSFNIRHLNFKF